VPSLVPHSNCTYGPATLCGADKLLDNVPLKHVKRADLALLVEVSFSDTLHVVCEEIARPASPVRRSLVGERAGLRVVCFGIFDLGVREANVVVGRFVVGGAFGGGVHSGPVLGIVGLVGLVVVVALRYVPCALGSGGAQFLEIGYDGLGTVG